MNMFINEPILVERRPTLSILDRACQASSRAGKPQLPFNSQLPLWNVFLHDSNSCVNMIILTFSVSVSVLLLTCNFEQDYLLHTSSVVLPGNTIYSSTLNFSEMCGLTGDSGCPR